MKRDMDLIRDILMLIDESETEGDISINIKEKYEKLTPVRYHLILMAEAGLISAIHRSHTGTGSTITADKEYYESLSPVYKVDEYIQPRRLTWSGYEYLESIRDPEIWEKVKSNAQSIGNFGLETLSAIARGLIKTKIQQHTGVEL